MVAEPSEKKKNIPEFRPGDTVKVHIKVVEGDSERIQVFEGTVMLRRGSGEAQTFTVRKISFGVGVERTFPLSSPHIDKIEVTKTGRVRRARLYYLRQLSGKAAKVDELETQPKTEGGSAPAAEKPASNDGAAKAHKHSEKAPEKKAHTEPGHKPALGAASAPK